MIHDIKQVMKMLKTRGRILFIAFLLPTFLMYALMVLLKKLDIFKNLQKAFDHLAQDWADEVLKYKK